jgi:hypothetical protein
MKSRKIYDRWFWFFIALGVIYACLASFWGYKSTNTQTSLPIFVACAVWIGFLSGFCFSCAILVVTSNKLYGLVFEALDIAESSTRLALEYVNGSTTPAGEAEDAG